MKRNWFKVGGITFLVLVLFLSINEYLLFQAGHLKTLVSDEALWSMERKKLDELDDQDIILLGASRMQVNMDLEELKKHLPGRQILQLALSGLGSSLPVLEDIVEHSGFSGTIIIDESQSSMGDSFSQQESVVNYYRNVFSVDKEVNKRISMFFQQLFLFVNPNSNSERLWGNLMAKGQLPAPMFTATYPSREQTSFFDITDTQWIYDIKMDGVKRKVERKPQDKNKWISGISIWKPLVRKFKEKGGTVIFVHMPYGEQRWQLENNWMPKEQYWDSAMNFYNFSSIHFADYPQLQGYKIPDSSHLDVESKRPFTREFVQIIKYFIQGES